MSLDTPFIKPHAVDDLKSPVAAPNIDDNFDAIWLALEQLRAGINTVEGEIPTVPPPHPLLDGDQNDDTVAVAPTVGALIYGNASALWDSLVAGVNTYFLRMVAGLPTWVSVTSLDFLHNLLSGTHQDTSAASPVHGDLIRAEAVTTGLTDTEKFYLDGAVYGGISGAADPSGCQFWLDGSPLDALVTGAAVSATLWRRTAAGSQGQVLTMNFGLPSWQDAGGVSASDKAVKAYQTVAQALTWNNPDAITFSTTEFDTSSFWAAGAPSRFTAPTAGYYSIVAQGTFENARFGLVYPCIFVNGVQVASIGDSLDNVDPSYGDYNPKQIAAIVHLNVGDYVEFKVRQVVLAPAAHALSTIPGQYRTWMSMAKVG